MSLPILCLEKEHLGGVLPMIDSIEIFLAPPTSPRIPFSSLSATFFLRKKILGEKNHFQFAVSCKQSSIKIMRHSSDGPSCKGLKMRLFRMPIWEESLLNLLGSNHFQSLAKVKSQPMVQRSGPEGPSSHCLPKRWHVPSTLLATIVQ